MSSSWSFDWSSPCPMEVNPVDTACTISNEDDSLSGHELHPNSVDLQPAGKIDMDGEATLQTHEPCIRLVYECMVIY